MTTLLPEWTYPLRLIQKGTTETKDLNKEFTVLIPVSLPSSGPELLRVATVLAPPSQLKVYGLHLSRPETSSLAVAERAADGNALQPLLDAAGQHGITVRPLTFVSREPGRDIADTAHVKGADLVLMGWHKPVLSQSILGGTVYDVMRQTRADVAVYLARQYNPWKRVLVPYTGNVHDRGALDLARRIGMYNDVETTILHVVKPDRETGEPSLGLSDAQETLHADGVRLKVISSADALETVIREAQQGYDLVIVGASEEWGLQPTLFGRRHEELARSCPASLLIVRKYLPVPEKEPAAVKGDLEAVAA
jgi:nucleotide-binding universal stress UspA family protein